MDRLSKIFKIVEKYASLHYQFYDNDNDLKDLERIKRSQQDCKSSAFDELLGLYKTGELKQLADKLERGELTSVVMCGECKYFYCASAVDRMFFCKHPKGLKFVQAVENGSHCSYGERSVD